MAAMRKAKGHSGPSPLGGSTIVHEDADLLVVDKPAA
jgi:23S rRNA-/tRNA-specific pseudouridylate synthase